MAAGFKIQHFKKDDVITRIEKGYNCTHKMNDLTNQIEEVRIPQYENFMADKCIFQGIHNNHIWIAVKDRIQKLPLNEWGEGWDYYDEPEGINYPEAEKRGDAPSLDGFLEFMMNKAKDPNSSITMEVGNNEEEVNRKSRKRQDEEKEIEELLKKNKVAFDERKKLLVEKAESLNRKFRILKNVTLALVVFSFGLCMAASILRELNLNLVFVLISTMFLNIKMDLTLRKAEEVLDKLNTLKGPSGKLKRKK